MRSPLHTVLWNGFPSASNEYKIGFGGWRRNTKYCTFCSTSGHMSCGFTSWLEKKRELKLANHAGCLSPDKLAYKPFNLLLATRFFSHYIHYIRLFFNRQPHISNYTIRNPTTCSERIESIKGSLAKKLTFCALTSNRSGKYHHC